MPKITVHSVDRGWRELVSLIDDLAKKGWYVKAGLLAGGPRTKDGALTMADLGTIHEFGTADGHVPARPFVRPAFEAGRPRYIEALRTLVRKVYSGKMRIEQALGIVGLMMATDIKKGAPGTPPPNAPSTIARKGSDVTLVDTGRMLGSVTYQVVTGAEGAA